MAAQRRGRRSGRRAGRARYRIGELAREAGITVRTVRYYQERKLLPPPRREGRIGWYSQAHLNRLQVIGELLDRGHTLSGIGQLLSAWEQGYDLADLLGFERAMTAPWSDEEPVPVTVADISALLEGQLTPEVLEEAIRLGYIDVDGERVTHVSRRLLDTTTALVREGIPLPAILATGRELQAGLDKLASLFMELVITPVLDRHGGAAAAAGGRAAGRDDRAAAAGRADRARRGVRQGHGQARPGQLRRVHPAARGARSPCAPAHPAHQDNRTHRRHLRHRVHQTGKPPRNSPGYPSEPQSGQGAPYRRARPELSSDHASNYWHGRRSTWERAPDGASQGSGRSGRGGHRSGAGHRSVHRQAPGRP